MPQALEPFTRKASAVCRALRLDDAHRPIDLASPMTTKVRIASAEGYSGAALRHVQVCVEQFSRGALLLRESSWVAAAASKKTTLACWVSVSAALGLRCLA